MPRVLLVEDEVAIADTLQFARVRAILKRSLARSQAPVGDSEFSIDTSRMLINYRSRPLKVGSRPAAP